MMTLKAIVPANSAAGFTTAGMIDGTSNLNSDLNLASRGSIT